MALTIRQCIFLVTLLYRLVTITNQVQLDRNYNINNYEYKFKTHRRQLPSFPIDSTLRFKDSNSRVINDNDPDDFDEAIMNDKRYDYIHPWIG